MNTPETTETPLTQDQISRADRFLWEKGMDHVAVTVDGVQHKSPITAPEVTEEAE